MNVLVWQWGRWGAGPRFAAELAGGLRALPGVRVALSLSSAAELLRSDRPPACELPVTTYGGWLGLGWRLAQLPFMLAALVRRVARLRPDLAICAMPAALDFVMAAALARLGVPFVVVAHDADRHPGDGPPLQMALQRRLLRRAQALVALTEHVGRRLREQRLVRGRLIVAAHPPLWFGPSSTAPGSRADGRLRLLSFGRLLPYKGLDLLAEALLLLGPRADLEVRVVGCGPESPPLQALRALAFVRVENRWVPEGEVAGLLDWADALVLSHREASQSGVASAAIAAGRWVVATRVGGLAEQLGREDLARLCDATPEALALALRRLLDGDVPGASPAAADPALAWRSFAEQLLRRLAPETELAPAAAARNRRSAELASRSASRMRSTEKPLAKSQIQQFSTTKMIAPELDRPGPPSL